MNRLEFDRIKGKWYWTARDVRGVACGKSHRGFSGRAACQHNASVVAGGIEQGLRLRRNA